MFRFFNIQAITSNYTIVTKICLKNIRNCKLTEKQIVNLCTIELYGRKSQWKFSVLCSLLFALMSDINWSDRLLHAVVKCRSYRLPIRFDVFVYCDWIRIHLQFYPAYLSFIIIFMHSHRRIHTLAALLWRCSQSVRHI